MNRSHHLLGLSEVVEEAKLVASWRRWQASVILPGTVPARQVWGSVAALGEDPASPGCVRQKRCLGDLEIFFLNKREGFHRNFSFILNRFKREI